jgi:hypothetical protein
LASAEQASASEHDDDDRGGEEKDLDASADDAQHEPDARVLVRTSLELLARQDDAHDAENDPNVGECASEPTIDEALRALVG